MCATTAATTKPAPYELTPDQIADFRRDGVIVIRGLLQGELLNDAIKAVETIDQSRTLIQRMFHKLVPLYSNLSLQSYRTSEALKTVAFDSAAPTICAKLMGLNEEEEKEQQDGSSRSLRLLKDGVFGFRRGDIGCGWHVDDKMFWPCEDIHNDGDNDDDKTNTNGSKLQPALKSEPRSDAGINVWITLSPVTAREGGGLAVAPGTHDLAGITELGKVALKARRAIVAKGGQTTCALQSLDPGCHAELEAIKKVYDLEPGDAILHNRYIFHRTEHFRDTTDDGDDAAAPPTGQKFRISMRYMPSDATYFNTGTGTDGAATEKHLVTGDPLWKAGEYFPQVWPRVLEAEAKTKAKADEPLMTASKMVKYAKKILASMIFGKQEEEL